MYHIQGMDEASNTITIHSETEGDGGIDLITELSGRARFIRLLCVTNNGNGVAVRELEVYYMPGQSATFPRQSIQPGVFTMSQNFPNPFNLSTTLSFVLPRSEIISLKIYNPSGQEVITLVDDFRNAGTHQIEWNAEEYTSGIYLVRLQAGNSSMIRKMILLK